MNCYIHTNNQSVGICKACQKAVCKECAIDTGRGVACSEKCAEEVKVLNEIIDRSKHIYSIGSSKKALPTGIIMYGFFGIVFLGWGIYNSMKRTDPDYFAIIMGIGFIGIGLLAYMRNKKLNINC